MHLVIDHDLFLLSNTTQGLMTAMAGLASDGIALRMSADAYPPYATLPAWPHAANMSEVSLQTHVDPLSGNVSIVSSTETTPSVLDAAHSFATIGHHRESLTADIFLCPLHKHAGISAGLGLLAIRKNLNLHGLHMYAEVAEAGASSRTLLEHAVEHIRAVEGRLVNLMSLEVDEDIRAALEAKGVGVLTPVGARLPFICLRGVDPARAASACSSVGLQAKFFRVQNIVRISGAIRGAIDSAPIDCSRMLKRALSILVKESR
ncbi:hypothetical protein DWV00_14075 [Trinickia dinghuensis]|uniref:Aminotransferase class V-fold PLP-dependent enzyme n=2 Tax=Trinickia dinghuensis TaxID=2291023 RepID=A0A3D8K0K3_9BURK|nr:hypothetical protein DWV00_14075 [Trinickia dinghuensis]